MSRILSSRAGGVTRRAVGISVAVSSGSTLEEEFISQAGWCPGLVGPSIQAEHMQWHTIAFPCSELGEKNANAVSASSRASVTRPSW